MSPTSQLTTFFHSPKISIAYVIVECCITCFLDQWVKTNRVKKAKLYSQKPPEPMTLDVSNRPYHIFDRLVDPTIPIGWRGQILLYFGGRLCPPDKLVHTKAFGTPAALNLLRTGQEA